MLADSEILIVRMVSLILLLQAPGCAPGSRAAEQHGFALTSGQAVVYQGFGNYAWSRGRVELWFRPDWDSQARGRRVIFQTDSRECNTEIGFQGAKVYFKLQGQIRATSLPAHFRKGDWLYIVADYDFRGHVFQVFLNGQAGAEEQAAVAEPDADWAGVPFKLWFGGVPKTPGSGDITLGRVRTGQRPLTAREVIANFDRLRASKGLEPDSSTLLRVRFDGNITTERGYGRAEVEQSPPGQILPTSYQPTALPSLDPILGPEERPASWFVSDDTWKAHSGVLQGKQWTRAEFDDTSWKPAVAKSSEIAKRNSQLYLYNDKPHHLESSRGQWIGFVQEREGYFRRSFTLSRQDKALLEEAPGTLYITAAEKFDCFLNGRWVGSNRGHFRPGYGYNPEVTTYWQVPQTLNIASLVHEGKNVIAVHLRHDPKISSDERQGLFVDWQKGKFNNAHFDWSSLPGAALLRPASLDLREALLRSLEYHFNTDFKSTLVEKGGIFYGWSYGDTLGRALEALVFLRAMTGIESFRDVDRCLMEMTLQTFTHRDGMSYRELAVKVPAQLEIPGSLPYACMWDQAEVLLGLVTWYEKTRSPILQDYIERMIRGLAQASLKQGDAFHIPEEFWDGGQWVQVPIWFNPGAVLLDPIAHYYEISGSPAAFELMKGLYQSQKRHLGRDDHVEHYFDEDFRLRTLKISGEGQGSENFGAGISLGWLGALRTALILHDQDMVDWISRAFDWAIGNAATRYGHVLEGLGYNPGEICGAADMVETATLLAEHKDPKYWDYVEEFIRNQIIQTQDPKTGMWGRVTPEGAMSEPLPCCSSRGVRGIYIAWHHIVTKKSEGVFVNLALNRDSPWLEVVSYLPYQGRLDLHIHNAPTVFVRIPEWAAHNQVKVEAGDKSLKVTGWQGNFAKIEGLEPGQQVSVRFPIGERETLEQFRLALHAPPVQFKVRWRGYTVIALSPNGKYDRAAMASSVVPMRKVKSYYQPRREIDW